MDSGLVTLYWHIGRRVHRDILKEKRAEYGWAFVFHPPGYPPFPSPASVVAASGIVRRGQMIVVGCVAALLQSSRATFDRFGLFSGYPGGQLVKIYLDDLKHTASRPAR